MSQENVELVRLVVMIQPPEVPDARRALAP
jgi:hypothetical protein